MSTPNAALTELPVSIQPDNPLWRYALAQWQNPDLARDCLELQSSGWSVTRILCAGWLGNQGCPFSGSEGATVTEWRSRVTGSIRNARKAIPRSHGDCEALREALAAAELQAERIELALAWQTLKNLTPENGTVPEPVTQIRQNLVAAAPCDSLPADTAELLDSLACQLAGAQPGGT